MNPAEAEARDAIAFWAHSLFARGLTFGSSGNISVRLADGWLITPTDCSFGSLRPEQIVAVDGDWAARDGGVPSKELPLHAAMYETRGETAAIVHLHSTSSVAVACTEDVDPEDVLPPITPYYVMRVGRLPLAPYRAPGDPTMAADVRELAASSPAILLANHGPIVAGRSLDDAVRRIEELEETAKLFLLLSGRRVRKLTEEQVAELNRRFPT